MARNNSYNPGFPVDPVSDRQIGQEINYVLNDAGLFVPVSDNDPLPIKGVGPAVDISGKNRASVRQGIFANTNFFSRNETIWNEVTSGGSETITHDFNRAACALTVGTASGEFALRQSFFRPPYDPGNPNRGQFTFVAPPWKVNQGLEIAFGDDDNGILLVRRPSDGALGFLLRSNASGSIDNSNVIYQDDWNGDKLNGSGESGFTLDITKRTLLWSTYLWQGVGPVEFGFQMGREWITCHTFENANIGDRPYVREASLPARYKIFNDGVVASPSTLYEICTDIESEGEHAPAGLKWAIENVVTARIAVTTERPIFAVRPKLTYNGKPNKRILELKQASFNASGNPAGFKIIHYHGISSVTGTFQDVDTTASAFEFSTNISAVTAAHAHKIEAEAVATGVGNRSTTQNLLQEGFTGHNFITTNYDQTDYQMFGVVAISETGTADCWSKLGIREFD